MVNNGLIWQIASQFKKNVQSLINVITGIDSDNLQDAKQSLQQLADTVTVGQYCISTAERLKQLPRHPYYQALLKHGLTEDVAEWIVDVKSKGVRYGKLSDLSMPGLAPLFDVKSNFEINKKLEFPLDLFPMDIIAGIFGLLADNKMINYNYGDILLEAISFRFVTKQGSIILFFNCKSLKLNNEDRKNEWFGKGIVPAKSMKNIIFDGFFETLKDVSDIYSKLQFKNNSLRKSLMINGFDVQTASKIRKTLFAIEIAEMEYSAIIKSKAENYYFSPKKKHLYLGDRSFLQRRIDRIEREFKKVLEEAEKSRLTGIEPRKERIAQLKDRYKNYLSYNFYVRFYKNKIPAKKQNKINYNLYEISRHDYEKSLSKETIMDAYDNALINDWEHEFSISTLGMCKCELSQKQLVHRVRINRKILNNFTPDLDDINNFS